MVSECVPEEMRLSAELWVGTFTYYISYSAKTSVIFGRQLSHPGAKAPRPSTGLRGVRVPETRPHFITQKTKEYPPSQTGPDRRATGFEVAMSQKFGSPGGRAFRARSNCARSEWCFRVSEYSEDLRLFRRDKKIMVWLHRLLRPLGLLRPPHTT